MAVGCQQCTAMLEGVPGPRPEVKDIAELVADALVTDDAERRPAAALAEEAI